MAAIVRPALRSPGSPARTLRSARSVPELRQKASFVSATLLSRTDFEKKTVAQLKDELKSRGLSTTGKNKSALLTRLIDDEKRRINQGSPPVPPLPASVKKVERSVSTSSVIKATEAPTPGSRGPNLMPSILNEGFKSKIWPASLTIPTYDDPPEPTVAIPYLPDKFDSHLTSEHADLPGAFVPEISTTSHLSTHAFGGPASAARHGGDDGEQLSPDQVAEMRAAAAAASGFWSDFVAQTGFGSVSPPPKAIKRTKQVKKAFEGVYNALEQQTGVKVPPMKEMLKSAAVTPEEAAQKAEQYKFKPEDRPLNQTEKTGVYALLGVVAGGFALASVFKPTSARKRAAREAAEAEKRSAGVTATQV